jgi:starvation-inducible DNA-binding protein
MTTQTLPNPSRLDLPADARGAVVQILNARLADAVDYALSLKQAHWNIKGRQFVALHEMLDTMHAEATEFGDLMAERSVMLGGQARGTLQTAAGATTLTPYPVEARAMPEHLAALADRLGVLTRSVRTAIRDAEAQDDAGSADLFTEVSRGLDKHLWYIEAHLAD